MSEELLAILWAAYLTGWAVAAPIGPVNLEIMRRVLRRGLAAGIALGAGACCADALYLTIFSVGLGAVLQTEAVQRVFFLAGGLFLTTLGVLAIRDAGTVSGAQALEEEAEPSSAGKLGLLGHWAVGLAMTASNPMTIAFWSALSLKFVDISAVERAAASLALLAGCFSWVLMITLTVAFARRYLSRRVFVALGVVGGAVVLFFGLQFLWRGLAPQ